MEKTARETLRQLKEICLRRFVRDDGDETETVPSCNCYDDTDTMVTISILALQLQAVARDSAGSVSCSTGASQESLSSLLESALSESLQEIASRETNEDIGPYTESLKDDFWSHCLEFAVSTTPDILDGGETPSNPLLKKAVSSVCQFTLDGCHLLEAFLSVSKDVLDEQQTLALLSRLHHSFWLPQAKRLAEHVATTNVHTVSMETKNDDIEWLIKLLSTVKCFFSVHGTIVNSLKDCHSDEGGKSKVTKKKKSHATHPSQVTKLWLCETTLSGLLDSLASSAPKLLWSAYERAVEMDNDTLKREVEISAAAPEELKMVDLLMSALFCLVNLSWEATQSPLAVKSAPLMITFVASETTLRLISHCWEELSKLVKIFPRELPVQKLYLVLAAFVKLHDFLTDCDHLTLNDRQKEIHSDLLHTLSESCGGLREQIVSYHTQLCLTSLLQDTSSQDWTSTKPFFEGERCSYPVQMWCHYLRGLKHDLCSLVAPTSCALAEKIFLSVMSSCLSHLARRYSSTTPSHTRVNQFRADILSILLTVHSLQPQLNKSSAALLSDENSPELTLIHRSCNQLLTVLAIGACPLTDLEEVLSHLSPSQPPITITKKNITGRDGDDEIKDLFREMINDCSCQWVSVVERYQSTLKGTTTETGATISLYGHESSTSMTQVSVTTVWFPYCVSNGNGSPKGTNRWSTPPNMLSATLLQALLSDHTSLAVTLCKSSVASESLVVDMASLFSLCWQDEWALSHFYKSFCKGWGMPSDARLENEKLNKEEIFMNWLAGRLQIELESYVLSMSTGLRGNEHDKAQVWQHIQSSLNGLGNKLTSSYFPTSIANLIWTMADDLSEGEVCNEGVRLAKLLAFLVSRWSTFAHLRLECPLGASVSAHLTSIVYSLSGWKPVQRGLPQIVEQVINSHQVELQSLLNQYDQFLPRPAETLDQQDGHSEKDGPTLTECEAMWEVIKEDDLMITSLRRIHSTLVKWWNRNRIVSTNGFHPQAEHNNHTLSMETVDNIDWKALVGGVIEVIATPTICNILERVRWEFQDGASGSLEERETELIKAVRTHLHYNDDCTV